MRIWMILLGLVACATDPTIDNIDNIDTDVQGGSVLAEGEFGLQPAYGFDDENFHAVVEIDGVVPEHMALGTSLIVQLWDLSRPDLRCELDHPTSGCATVDWSDFADRRGVPADGVFDNHLVVQLASGERTFYLSEHGGLNDEPDEYSPT